MQMQKRCEVLLVSWIGFKPLFWQEVHLWKLLRFLWNKLQWGRCSEKKIEEKNDADSEGHKKSVYAKSYIFQFKQFNFFTSYLRNLAILIQI